MVSKVLNVKGKVSVSVANKHIASLRCWSLSHRWLDQGKMESPCVLCVLCKHHSHCRVQGTELASTVHWTFHLAHSGTCHFHITVTKFNFGNSGLLTDLIKYYQDELEFPVGQTILILCNSYIWHESVYLAWMRGPDCVKKKSVLS